MGEGDCSSEVVNLSGRGLEVYFYLGLQNPPRILAGWPRLGMLGPLKSSVIYMDCDYRLIRIRAYATGPVDPRFESAYVGRDITLVKGRREIVRLRLER